MSTAQVIQKKVSALPPEKQEQLLDYADWLAKTPASKTGEPYSALKTAASLDLDLPPDASKRFHEYLYSETKPRKREAFP